MSNAQELGQISLHRDVPRARATAGYENNWSSAVIKLVAEHLPNLIDICNFFLTTLTVSGLLLHTINGAHNDVCLGALLVMKEGFISHVCVL